MVREEILLLKSEDGTKALARKIASEAKKGDIIALNGELGAGKTTFTKYFAKELGVNDMIQSPTFTVVREYDGGRLPLYHFDVYRVNDEDELFEMGFFEYLESQKGVCLIEWADLIEEILPAEILTIDIAYGESEGERIVKIYSKEEDD